MRVFIGIGLPQEIRQSLCTLQQELAKAGADVKWVEPANLHLTLKFLGEITEEQRQAVEKMLKSVTVGHAPCAVSLGALGAFPTLTVPRVLWVDFMEGKRAMEELAQAIGQEAERIGLPREERAFAAHLTLGRVRSPRRGEALVNLLRTLRWKAPEAWQADRVTLYQSLLRSKGPTYTVLGEFLLLQQ